MVTTASPRASRKPAMSAAALPKLRRRRTTPTSGSAVARSVRISEVPSVDPSSTKRTSTRRPSVRSTARSSSVSGRTDSRSL